MPYDENTGVFRPPRRSNVRCHGCYLKFAEGGIPEPDQRGRRLCRDCKSKGVIPR